MKPRIIAFYLPQFHTIPENDEWWGKGFTEWVNVRKAKPLYSEHQQPKVPLNSNYYDLTNPETLRWQAGLANKYGVYGMCMYHYWFCGKLLLQKPAELLLANADIPMRFCFSWANEPWARTWDGKIHEILMPQSYGMEQDWKQHFDYLLPFFKDERYIKVDGCPMFLIYKPQSIPCAKQMMDCWNELAAGNGFNGMHFVETLRGKQTDKRNLPFKARVEFEPIRTNMQQPAAILNYKRIRRRVVKLFNAVFNTSHMLNKPFRFDDVAHRSLQLQSPVGTYGGAFVGWDNTARRGLASTIVEPPAKQQFETYLRAKVKQTTCTYKTNYVFINAWNEWAEGATLEPDETHGYGYLEAIYNVVNEYK